LRPGRDPVRHDRPASRHDDLPSAHDRRPIARLRTRRRLRDRPRTGLLRHTPDVRLRARLGGARSHRQRRILGRAASDPALAPVGSRGGAVVKSARRWLSLVAIEIWLPLLLVTIWWFASERSTSVYFPPL